MKKLTVLLVLGFMVITGCMIYLIKHGVSVRLEPVIDQTLTSIGESGIAKSLIFRLTPQFQPAHYVLIGRDPTDAQSNVILENLVSEFEKAFKSTPNVVREISQIDNCKSPCWIITDQKSSNQLNKNSLIESIKAKKVPFFTLTFLGFKRDIEVPGKCDAEKIITDDCLVPIAVRSVKRKFKEDSRYYFVSGYFEQDYFLLLER